MKNDATEKVEKLTEKNKKENKTEPKTYKKAYKTEKVDKTDDRNEPILDKKAEKEKNMRLKRIEDAKLRQIRREKRNAEKAKLKEKRMKAKKAKKEVLKKRKEEYKQEKLRRKEERLARRDILKHESREEREKRVAAEKQARRREKNLKRQAIMKERLKKAEIRRQKRADKRAIKEQKIKTRNENRREKRNRGLGGWLAAVIALGSTTLVLATLFTLSMLNVLPGSETYNADAVAESYYSLVDYVDNIDVNLSKLIVSNDNGERQRILVNLIEEASLAAEDITRIPLKDESKFYTTKYINQVADYSKYLNNRLIDGDSLTETDKENLNSLYKINTALREELFKLNQKMGDGYDFKTIMNENDDNLMLEKFNELEKRAVDYPKLIYDGPFSDSEDKKERKTSESIPIMQAEEKFKNYFGDYEVKNVETLGEQYGKIECYSIKADGKDGEIHAFLSKEKGELIMFNYHADCSQNNFGLEECIKIADKYIQNLGYDNMASVWATESGNTAYINYCYSQNGVIIYPDMIKVTVCKERGLVSAFDSTAYSLNHKTRDIKEPEISLKTAETGLSTDLYVLATRLCIIPKGETKEVLAYEFFGKYNGSEYYIYVDALTGKETQIFKVVETTEGNLMM